MCQGRLQGGNSAMQTFGLNFDLLDLTSIFRKLVQIDSLFLDHCMIMGLLLYGDRTPYLLAIANTPLHTSNSNQGCIEI